MSSFYNYSVGESLCFLTKSLLMSSVTTLLLQNGMSPIKENLDLGTLEPIKENLETMLEISTPRPHELGPEQGKSSFLDPQEAIGTNKKQIGRSYST